MKFIILPLALLICLSCSDSAAATETVAANTAPAPATKVVVATPDHPCDAVSGSMVAQALGWEGANEAMPTTMSDGRIQSCFYSSTNDIGASTMTIKQSSERTIERKGLERVFATDLTNEGKLTFEDVSGALGDQAIFGHGKTGPSFTYKLRWRDGNAVDYSVDATYYKKMDPAAVLVNLRKLAEKMKNS